jgi:CheY-like chemotaxis protein
MMDEKLELLLVEDAPMIRQVTALLLSRTFEVTTCADGEEAIELLHNGFLPALIVTDYEMPILNGMDLIRAVRAIPLSCPILMFSSLKDDATRQMALELGANAYLVKPVSPLELRRQIMRLLENPQIDS